MALAGLAGECPLNKEVIPISSVVVSSKLGVLCLGFKSWSVGRLEKEIRGRFSTHSNNNNLKSLLFNNNFLLEPLRNVFSHQLPCQLLEHILERPIINFGLFCIQQHFVIEPF